ncbi:PD-(D/E)XK motif protein [Arthrobacter sp. APC 3897]|uniref:PD-(D/E)XK motif protein n=1 Tax=Arthrobacter sp. APC 3897 TaxID=3035204 RepID=UPI0025B47A68|nr:PD-(D/E)XK motif protein [Arthrobacter sp. APC 3897]MDN3483678.1 PD-(D/E)XK motif protein [Arthrobacter sp. APC 3897]
MSALAAETLRIASALASEGTRASETMRASWMPGRKDDLLAVDNEGSFVLLVRQYGSEGGALQRNHRVFAVLPCREYTVRVEDEEFRERYRAIVLRSGNEHLLSAFSILTATLLSYLPMAPSSDDIDTFMAEIIELFDVQPEVSMERVVGLWGELSIISSSKDPQAWLRAWHVLPNSVFDFSFGELNVEVKTGMGAHPLHHFSHSQLTQDPRNSYIASVLVREDRGGKSIIDLVEDICAGLSVEAQSVLERRVMRAFGREVELARDLRFSLTESDSPRFLRAEYVPRVVVSPGLPISDISYRVDLSACLTAHGSASLPASLS